MFAEFLRRMAVPGPVEPPSAEECREAVAALMVRVARADEKYTTIEQGQIDRLIADDLEFYHDKAGLSYASGEAFLADVNCLGREEGDPVFTRKLIPGTLMTYQIGEDYALQTGRHEFYQVMQDAPDILRETAPFIHLWHRSGQSWELIRVISYDHRTPADQTPR